jgi:hypothetical protein
VPSNTPAAAVSGRERALTVRMQEPDGGSMLWPVAGACAASFMTIFAALAVSLAGTAAGA